MRADSFNIPNKHVRCKTKLKTISQHICLIKKIERKELSVLNSRIQTSTIKLQTRKHFIREFTLVKEVTFNLVLSKCFGYQFQ